MPVCLFYGVFWNRLTHYDVIVSRDCRTAAHKAALLSVTPHVTDLLLPAPSTGCGWPARFMLHMLIRASLRRRWREDRHYWWSQRVISVCRAKLPTMALPLRRYASCPLQSANAFSLWVLSWQVWMQLQFEYRFWKNVTGAQFWKWVPDNRILLNNLNCITSYAYTRCTTVHYKQPILVTSAILYHNHQRIEDY